MSKLKVRLKFFLTLTCLVMLAGTLGFMFFEDLPVNDAFYFTFVSITTVGYGDISPKTDAGKGFAIVLILMGVGTFLAMVATATESIINKREKNVLLEKIHLINGLFYRELGTSLMQILISWDPEAEKLSPGMTIGTNWKKADFANAAKNARNHGCVIDPDKISVDKLCEIILPKRDLVVRLLENPVMFEHQEATGLLQAVFHLADEIKYRIGKTDLPRADLEHLAGDCRRVYLRIIGQWLDHMSYLKDNYPYLYSLEVRVNPFREQPSAVIEN